MSDASGGGKKPPVAPSQAGPAGRAGGERGLPGSFPLVLKKLMENPPREARLGEGRGLAVGGACFYTRLVGGRGLMWAGLALHTRVVGGRGLLWAWPVVGVVCLVGVASSGRRSGPSGVVQLRCARPGDGLSMEGPRWGVWAKEGPPDFAGAP